jgi:hypothetical protein
VENLLRALSENLSRPLTSFTTYKSSQLVRQAPCPDLYTNMLKDELGNTLFVGTVDVKPAFPFFFSCPLSDYLI